VKIRRAELNRSCAQPGQFPATPRPEVAFLGRSNVGKSSLLNALVQRKQLARTSSTPGKTRMIHFFEVDTEVGEWMFVDLPGYGWARVSRKEREGWRALVEAYLEGSTQLRTAILLQDLRRDFSEDETLLLDWLAERGIDAMVVLTKADKLKPMRRAKRARELRAQLAKPDLPLLLTSSQARQGIPELWQAIRQRA